jgi:hypothetical protein
VNVWTELYDPKVGRKLREIPLIGTCGKCGEWNGHKLDCEEVDTHQLYRIAKAAQKSEEYYRERADRFWRMIQQYQGKIAVLKHENNKLRRANERAKAKGALLADARDTLCSVESEHAIELIEKIDTLVDSVKTGANGE